MRILMVSRATLFLQPGGDTIQITKTAQYINKVKGISVDIKTVSDKIDYINYDKSIGEFNTQIDLSNYSKGIYNLTIKTSDGLSNHKLILQ